MMKKILILFLMIIMVPGALSIVDLDQDGFCDVDRISCASDYCPGTEFGAIVDDFGCSCDQKTVLGCEGYYCCPYNPDSCEDSCAEIDFKAACTENTMLGTCGKFRECLKDGCYSAEHTYWYDFPESGHDYCEDGVCKEYSCNATEKTINDSRCDYELCQKTYGAEYSCQDDNYVKTECQGKGETIPDFPCPRISGISGVCVKCGSDCNDPDDGIVIFEKTTVTKNGTAYVDYCMNNRTLVEYYCGRDAEVKEIEYDCSEYSQICVNGMCGFSRKKKFGEPCNHVDQCEYGLICTANPEGKSQHCCNIDQCYDGSACVDNYQDIVFNNIEYRCVNGNWVEKDDLLDCYITDGVCPGEGIINIGNTFDSHASIFGQNPYYNNTLCCESDKISVDPSGTYLFSLSNPPDDAHISLFEASAFPNKIYLKVVNLSLQCTVRDQCSNTFNLTETCLFGLSDDLANAHISDCTDPDFKNKYCCALYDSVNDKVPPIMVVDYDGVEITVVTNEYASCKLLYSGKEIPCIGGDCKDHHLIKKIYRREVVSCSDASNNTNHKEIIGCVDGTPVDTCSDERPNYCSDAGIVEDCTKCGCPSESPHCDDDGTCRSLGCLEPTPTTGSALSAWMLTLNDPIIRQTADEAIEEYADLKNVEKDMINSADEYFEAVAYFIDKNMVWTPCLPYREASRIIRESGANNCGKRFCGCCTDHAVVRTALLRSLGVKSTCVFTTHGGYVVDNLGHEYNTVKYKNAFRIMDYGPMGSYFTRRWEYHATDGLWNDYLGSYSPFVNNLPAQLTYNYPIGSQCPEGGWTDDTYYTDVCP